MKLPTLFRRRGLILLTFLALGMLMASCTGQPTPEETAVTTDDQMEMLVLPQLTAVSLNGGPLQVVATTSIIGDVVAQVGGDAIQLTTLIAPGQDPHSYEPAARDLATAADADVIFVNGWDLEESLVRNLENSGEDVPLVPVSAHIVPLAFGEDEHEAHEAEETAEDDHEHSGADPHVWQSIPNVVQWVKNIQEILSTLDPANTAVYENNAAAYLAELAELETYAAGQLTAVPPENRVLITNHDALGYFAHEYGFEILGTVIPGVSTLTEASASDLAALVELMAEHGACTIFTENTGSMALAQAVAAELQNCDGVQVIQLYSDALGPVGSGADSYITMFRANVDAIVGGLE